MIELNFEVGCNRNLMDGSFANGLQNFRFSVSPAGNGSWGPSMSYFLVEYAFGIARITLTILEACETLHKLSESAALYFLNSLSSVELLGAYEPKLACLM